MNFFRLFGAEDGKRGIDYYNGIGCEVDFKKALKQFHKESTEEGNADSQLLLGQMYLLGRGCPRDTRKAFEFFKKSAEQENPKAQFNLGLLYLKGEGCSMNRDEAFKLFQRNAERGDAESQNALGNMYFNGFGCEKDKRKAFEMYEQSAAQNNLIAQCNLGVMYDTGDGVPQDKHKAFEMFQKSAEQGYDIAQFNLGLMYYLGEGCEANQAKAFEMYQKAAEQGNAIAQFNLGSMYDRGEGCPADKKRAFDMFLKSAAQGNAGALFNLGIMLNKGEGCPVDKKNAFEMFQRSADLGYPSAIFNLGIMCEKGEGCTMDKKKAFEMYQRSSDLGDPFAQCHLGSLYFYGEGCPIDHKRAFELFQLSASQKNSKAQYYLGMMRRCGIGCTMDKPSALILFQQSSAQGHAGSMSCLANMFETGEGCSVDKFKAFDLYKKAKAGIAKENDGTVITHGQLTMRKQARLEKEITTAMERIEADKERAVIGNSIAAIEQIAGEVFISDSNEANLRMNQLLGATARLLARKGQQCEAQGEFDLAKAFCTVALNVGEKSLPRNLQEELQITLENANKQIEEAMGEIVQQRVDEFQDRIQREYMTSSDELDKLRLQLQTERAEFEQKLAAALGNGAVVAPAKEEIKPKEEDKDKDKGFLRASSEGRRKRIEGGRSEMLQFRRENASLNRREGNNSNTTELKQKLATAEEAVAREKQRVDLLHVQLEELLFHNLLAEIERKIASKRETKVKCWITFAWQPDKLEIPALLSKLVIVKEDLMKLGVDAELDVHKLAGDVVQSNLDQSTKILMVLEPPNDKETSKDGADKQILRLSIGSSLHPEADLLLDLTDHQQYYETMVALNPAGVVPTLLQLERDPFYAQLLDNYRTRINILNI